MKKEILMIAAGFLVFSLASKTYAEETNACKTNKDCPEENYCDISAGYSPMDKECYSDFQGICKPKGEAQKITYDEKELLVGPYMSYWGAQNWCEAQGSKGLIELKTLGIKENYKKGFCGGNSCDGADWQTIQATLGKGWFWTKENYDDCFSFALYPEAQRIRFDFRNLKLFKPICE